MLQLNNDLRQIITRFRGYNIMTYIDLNENKNFKPLIERKVVDAQDGTLKEKKGISEGAIYRAKKLMEL